VQHRAGVVLASPDLVGSGKTVEGSDRAGGRDLRVGLLGHGHFRRHLHLLEIGGIGAERGAVVPDGAAAVQVHLRGEPRARAPHRAALLFGGVLRYAGVI